MKKIVYVDMDGVVADFDKGIDLKGITRSRDERREQLPQGFFEELEPIEGAIEALHKLSEVYDVYFLSTPQWDNPCCWSEKRLWVAKHYGDLMYKKLILTHHKRLLRGDYLIDDIVHEGFQGEHIHFGTEKFPNWKTVLDYLLKPEVEQVASGLSKFLGQKVYYRG